MLTNSRENSTFDSTSRIEIAAAKKSTTMNQVFNMFDTQIIKTSKDTLIIEKSKISNYAILKQELN
jgi:hypothetical protein